MRTAIFGAALACLIATQAKADPCEAPISGFAAGQIVSGIVSHVGDGDSLCVAPSARSKPSRALEIRLADFYAPELREEGGRAAKAELETLAKGKRVACTITRGPDGRFRSYDRLIAVCRLRGVSLGDIMRAGGVGEGGRGFR